MLITSQARPLRRRRRFAPWYSNNILPVYEGFVATRGRVPLNLVAPATTNQIITRSRHVATDDISALKLGYCSWCISAGVETGIGAGQIQVFASVEYPIGTIASPGTRTRITFDAGAQSATFGSSATKRSDVTTLGFTIPKGAEFFVWTFMQGVSAGNVPYRGNQDTANGEGCQKAASGLTDVTLSGTITPNDSSMWYGPTILCGQTKKRSVLIIGDSRPAGGGDTYDGLGFSSDFGEVERSLGAYGIGYSNLGSPGGDAIDYITDHSRQGILYQFCSDMLHTYGQNDFNAGASTATMQSRAQSIRGYATAANKRPHYITISPQTTGAWTLADGSDQSTTSAFAQKEPFNNWLRTGGLTGTIIHDVASVVEVAGTGKWKANGTPAKYTADGIHASQFAYRAIRDARVINPAYFV